MKVFSDDQPWYNDRLRALDRKMKREYFKNKKSEKWSLLRQDYSSKCEKAKASYYENMVKDLKDSKPSQWYSKLKRMSNQKQAQTDDPVVLSIDQLPNQTQAEVIADEFSAVSNLYEPLNEDDITTRSSNKLLKVEAEEVSAG